MFRVCVGFGLGVYLLFSCGCCDLVVNAFGLLFGLDCGEICSSWLVGLLVLFIMLLCVCVSFGVTV